MFPVRIFYAPAPELIKDAVDFDYTHVVIHSIGHAHRNEKGISFEMAGKGKDINDDLPLFFHEYPLLKKERSKIAGERILRVQERINYKISLAVKLGLKPLLSIYELSLPYNLQKFYPEFYPGNNNFCMALPENQKFIEDKIAEVFETFPKLAGIIFTAKEATEGQYYMHKCKYCQSFSQAERLNMLLDAIRKGKDKVKVSADIIFRIWGMHFPDIFYRKRIKTLWAWTGKKASLKETVEKCSRLPFEPKKVLSELANICDKSIFISTKATWQDFDLMQPENPWTGCFPRNKEIIEISYECYCRPTEKYFLLANQMKRFSDYAHVRKVKGVMALPCAFGFTEVWDEKSRQFVFSGSNRSGSTYNIHRTNNHSITAFTPFLISKLISSRSEINVKDLLIEYLFRKHGINDGAKLADTLIGMEKLAHDIINCNGFSILSPNHYMNDMSLQLEAYKEHASWSTCTLVDGDKKILSILKNLPAFFEKKDKLLHKAEANLTELKCYDETVKKNIFDMYYKTYAGFVDILKLHLYSQKIALTMWAIERGNIQATEKVINFVLNSIREKEKILLNSVISEDLKGPSREDRLYCFKGIQRYNTLS